MSNYWRLILCKEAGNCNCFSADSQPNEEKDDTEHRIVVSDILQLVQDKQKVPATQPGPAAKKKYVSYNNLVI